MQKLSKKVIFSKLYRYKKLAITHTLLNYNIIKHEEKLKENYQKKILISFLKK